MHMVQVDEAYGTFIVFDGATFIAYVSIPSPILGTGQTEAVKKPNRKFKNSKTKNRPDNMVPAQVLVPFQVTSLNVHPYTRPT